MTDLHLVELKTQNFSGVVPWTFAIPAPKLLVLMSETDPIKSFTMTLFAFRELVAEDKLQELDNLDLNEISDLINQWLNKTNSLREQEKDHQ